MTAADCWSFVFLADLCCFFGSWMIWLVKPSMSMGTLPDLSAPFVSRVALAWEDLVESLPF